MKISSTWIKSWLSHTISNNGIIQAIEKSGIEIEQSISSIELDSRIVVGIVKKVVQHPDAEQLHICEVEVGNKHELTIVCGAPNVRANLHVAVATIGSILPDGTIIKQAKLRGQISAGMLCSERELGLGEDHDGIMELSSSTPIGSALCDIMPFDVTIDIKTSPNRPDLQSVIGVAREVAAFSNNELKPLITAIQSSSNGPQVDLEASFEDVPRYMITLVELSAHEEYDVELTNWITSCLQASDQRAVHPVVDITNFVMAEYGQPLHAYDADKVTLPLGVRSARDGEELMTLDGVMRHLKPEDLVVVDAHGPIGLAGVMGGATTQVTATTRRILLEAATFNGAKIRKTAQRHNLRSEASSRYERRLPLELPPLALARALKLLDKVTAAKSISGVTDILRAWPWVTRIGLRGSYLTRLLGFTPTQNDIVESLRSLEIAIRPFDIAAEARKFLGRPYKFGANFKVDGTSAFDCSYLTDYIYSLISVSIGHTAYAQSEAGLSVEVADLLPGDILFRGGPWVKLDAAERGGVSHCALYIGNNKVIEAADYRRENNKWVKLPESEQQVVERDVTDIIHDPQYIGARRYVANLDDYYTVESVPWWRIDLRIAADLVEEIARIIGYESIPATIPVFRPTQMIFDRRYAPLRRLKDSLSAAGLFEVTTYSFIGAEQLELAHQAVDGHLELANPLTIEQTYLRQSLLASHLQVLARNRGYSSQIAFYEVSRVFTPVSDAQPLEPTRLGVTIFSPHDSFRNLKGVLELISSRLAVVLNVKPNRQPSEHFMPNRAGYILLGRERIGEIGQLSPALVRDLRLEGEITYAELDVEAILDHAQSIKYESLSRFPVLTRDVTIALPDDITWAQITRALNDRSGVHIEYIGEYRGDGVAPGTRNISFRLVLRYDDRTPTENEAIELETWAHGRLHDVVTNQTK